MTINEAVRRFERVDLRNQVPVIVELTKDEIILLNQAQMYQSSIDSEGNQLGGYYFKYYEDLKKGLNPGLGGKVDLYLTGDFYGGFYVKVEDMEFIIGSNDSKSDELENKYGKIFGLTDESRTIYAKGVFFQALRNFIEGITKISMQ